VTELQPLIDGIQATAAPAGMTTKIIGIDGGGGAGKSTLAQRLSDQLGDVIVVHTDDFMNGANSAPDWWKRLIAELLEPLKANQTARYQRFDWPTDQLAEWHEIAPGKTILLEGVGALRREFRPYLSYGIWLDTPAETRLARGLERDGQHRLEDWKRWMEWDEQYAKEHEPRAFADAVVSGGTHIEDQ